MKSKAGDLVLGDARVLHGARKNQTDQRRNLLLLWHNRPETVPDYWEDEIPKLIQNRDSEASYTGTRIPRNLLSS